MAYLEMKNISKKYDGASNYTLYDLNLKINKGEIVTLLGKSGCGKTTILRLISGFEIPNQGEIILNGKVISSNSVWISPQNRGVGMVFQDYALFPSMTVFQNVSFGLNKDNDYKKKTEEMLRLVELLECRNKYPNQLSGGQQQRVALARALIRQPMIILLDEPFSNLDVDLKESTRTKVLKILRKTETTAIFVTHDQMEALSISQRVALVAEGKIQQIASPQEIYTKPENLLVAKFIGSTNILEGAVKDKRTILCDIGELSCLEDIPYKTNKNIKFIIRPEYIEIDSNGIFTGTIINCSYTGMYYKADVSISINGGRNRILKIILDGKKAYKIGQQIRFNLYIKTKEHVFD